jgi:arylsulfatase A-like enzyme
MHAIMVMFDSLRRGFLPGYGSIPGIRLPNFERLTAHTVVFDRNYACSLPCMPARRELHTGRPNFLHRSWGPVEPFDDSMPEILKQSGIRTHLSTDHYHYLQDGGAAYCERYSSWECYRGQESDLWQPDLEEHDGLFSPYIMINSDTPSGMIAARKKTGWQNLANRQAMTEKKKYPQIRTFENGLGFLDRFHAKDNWFLQIEAFDPHEPFTVPHDTSGSGDDGTPDWPPYAHVMEDRQTVDAMRMKYFRLLQCCDENLGRVLDRMDQYDLWKDTLLIVNTDHGFLLGEHGWWGKNIMPDYDEIVHIPLYIWDPRCGRKGEHEPALVQTIDLAPTLLDYFGIPVPPDMTGHPLGSVLLSGTGIRSYAMFGIMGGPLNITDGRYVYMRAVRDESVGMNEYTLMPTHMNRRFTPEELKKATFSEPFRFTKQCPLLRIPSTFADAMKGKLKEDFLFDLSADPGQSRSVQNPQVKCELTEAMKMLMDENDAPEEVYGRYGIPFDRKKEI